MCCSTPTISGCFASLLRGLTPCQLRQYRTFMHFGPQPQRLNLIRMNKKKKHAERRENCSIFHWAGEWAYVVLAGRNMNGRHYCGCKCDCCHWVLRRGNLQLELSRGDKNICCWNYGDAQTIMTYAPLSIYLACSADKYAFWTVSRRNWIFKIEILRRRGIIVYNYKGCGILPLFSGQKIHIFYRFFCSLK